MMENGELDGEIDFLNQDAFLNTSMAGQYLNSCSMDDSFLDGFLNDAHACTHTHTCNPPGPDFSHSHTCFHVHTKILPAPSEDKTTGDDSGESVDKKSKKRPMGNREAVRKYREKKKARAASLEDEVVRLRALNQQLMKKLQAQAGLEAEVARLKCLLVDFRGRIEGEIGSFPYQKSVKRADGIPNVSSQNVPGSYMMNQCELRCDDQAYCLQSGIDNRGGGTGTLSGQGLGACDVGSAQCMENFDSVFVDVPDCGRGNMVPRAESAVPNKRKGGTRTPAGG